MIFIVSTLSKIRILLSLPYLFSFHNSFYKLFLYTKYLSKIAKKYGLEIQLYADDSQLYIGFKPLDSNMRRTVIERIECCLKEIMEWMASNFMKLNKDKTQVIMLGTNNVLKKTEDLKINVGASEVIESAAISAAGVISLGVKLDHNLNLKSHISKVRQSAFYNHIQPWSYKESTFQRA